MTFPPNSTLSIVLADDDIDDCFLFEEVIEELPFTVNLRLVHNRVELMELLTNQHGEFPVVLFLDLNMPRKNGLESVDDIRSNSELSQIPIVIYSTPFDPAISYELYKKGANYFIQKPSSLSKHQKIPDFNSNF